MIEQKQPFDQLPNEIKPAFQELKVLKHLRDAGFRKKFGSRAPISSALYLSCCFTRRTGSVSWKARKVKVSQVKTRSIVS